MILVYLANSATRTAIQAAYDVKKFIDQGRGMIECPICTSNNTFISRKSTGHSRWMELEGACGDCPARFPVPDEAVRGFWRNDDKEALEVRTVEGGLGMVEEFVDEVA